MSYTPRLSSPPPPQPPPQSFSYSSTPPAPPPKPSGPSTPSRGPPLPPPPPGSLHQTEPSELDATQTHPSHPTNPHIPLIEPTWLPPNLPDKPTPDLSTLLNDTTLQSALLDNPHTTHPSVSASLAPLTPLITTNLTLSTTLLDLETRLAQKRRETQSRLLALRALEQQHRTNLAETEDALKDFSPMALYQRLSAGAPSRISW
ncbi:Modifier of rudimentary (Mod(r)) protein [Teratosphaeria destructans]|uniref:Modifier of rudimentary (Mod(R)) protein n=1 Tax=Teratosphaeria destructans TaxID=418781 RepID=A0A9W7SPU0_9PEZI|nr:Modifier of rudimentary (Mod(r)) protein [Teratosphaeria destructans]